MLNPCARSLAMAAVLACAACGSTPDTQPPTTARSEAAVDALAPDVRRVLAMLPASGQGVVYTPTLAAFVDGFAANQALSRTWALTLAPLCHDLIDVLVEHAGDADTLAAYGLDLQKPAGMASVDPYSTTSVLFFSIADDAAFQTLLDDTARATNSVVEHRNLEQGRLDVLANGTQHVYMIRREEVGILLMCPSWRERCLETADLIGRTTPPTSWLGQPDVVATLAAASPDALLTGVVSQRARGQALVQYSGGEVQANLSRQRAITADIQRATGNPQFQADLRRELDRLRAEHDELQGRLALQTEHTRELYDALGALHTELDMVEGVPRIEMRGTVRSSGLLSSVLDTGRPGPGRFARALAGPQLGLTWIDVDVARWRQEDARAHAVGYSTPLSNLIDLARYLSGRNVAEIVDLLDGQLGIAVTRPELSASADLLGVLRAFDVAAVIGLRDVETTRAWIESLRSDPMVALLLRPDGPDGYTLTTVAWKPLTLAFVDGSLVIGSDETFVERYRASDDGGYLASLDTAAAAPLTSADTFFHLQLDLAMLGALGTLEALPELPDAIAGNAARVEAWSSRLDDNWTHLIETTATSAPLGLTTVTMQLGGNELVLRTEQRATSGANAATLDLFADWLEALERIDTTWRDLRDARPLLEGAP